LASFSAFIAGRIVFVQLLVAFDLGQVPLDQVGRQACLARQRHGLGRVVRVGRLGADHRRPQALAAFLRKIHHQPVVFVRPGLRGNGDLQRSLSDKRVVFVHVAHRAGTAFLRANRSMIMSSVAV
jgi:hypothetical protein